jgi:hypothetical protein
VGPMQAVMQGVITIFFYAMVIAAVWKLFMMAADIGEIRKLLTDIRSNTAPPALRAVEVPAGVQIAAIPAAPIAVATTPIAAAPPPPPIAAGPISLESAEALLREIEAEERALAAQSSKPVAQ